MSRVSDKYIEKVYQRERRKIIVIKAISHATPAGANPLEAVAGEEAEGTPAV